MMDALKVGVEVLTVGGIYGTVRALRDDAGHHVERAAGGKRHDELDGLAGERRLRARRPGAKSRAEAS